MIVSQYHRITCKSKFNVKFDLFIHKSTAWSTVSEYDILIGSHRAMLPSNCSTGHALRMNYPRRNWTHHNGTTTSQWPFSMKVHHSNYNNDNYAGLLSALSPFQVEHNTNVVLCQRSISFVLHRSCKSNWLTVTVFTLNKLLLICLLHLA